MAGSHSQAGPDRALIRWERQHAPGAYLGTSLGLALLVLMLVAIPTGQPLLGIGVLAAAIVSAVVVAWRSPWRRLTPELTRRREHADRHLAAGRYGKARELYESVITIARRDLQGGVELVEDHFNLAVISCVLEDYSSVDPHVEEVLRRLDVLPTAWVGHTAWLLRKMAHHHSSEGRHARALSRCEQALELVGAAPGADDTTVRSIVDDLGWVHYQAGDYPAAERAFRMALSAHEQFRDAVREIAQRGDDDASTSESPYRMPGPGTAVTSGGLDEAVASSLVGLGWTVYERGRYREARTCFDRARAVATAAPVAATDLRIESLRGSAAVHVTLGHFVEATELYREALAEAEGQDDLRAAALQIDLGWLARSREHHDDAAAAYDRALAILERQTGGSASMLSALFEHLAELYRRQGQLDRAAQAIERALEIGEPVLGRQHPRLGAVLSGQARVHAAAGNSAEAERSARHGLKVLRARLGDLHLRVADAFLALGEAHLAAGDAKKAESPINRALELKERTLGVDHPELVEILGTRVELLRGDGREQEALATEARRVAIRGRLATA